MITTEFSDWLWEHILTTFWRKIKEWIFGILGNSSFRNYCVHFMAARTKKVRIIKIWAVDIFLVEVFHYFRLRCNDQRRRGPVLVQNFLFSVSSSTPPSPSEISTPTWKNAIEFMNWLPWEGCGVKWFRETRNNGVYRCLTRILTVLYLSISVWFWSKNRVMRKECLKQHTKLKRERIHG